MSNYEMRVSRGGLTAAEAAKRAGVSKRTAQRWTSRPREKYLADMAAERERIRAYHDEQGHTWLETAAHFGVSEVTARQRGYRARQERAAEQAAIEAAKRALIEPMLPIEFD